MNVNQLSDAELNALVHEAVREKTHTTEGDIAIPRIDSWDSAMEAAEIVGLFHPQKHDAVLFQNKKNWSVSGNTFVVYDAGGPRAICKAIAVVSGKVETET